MKRPDSVCMCVSVCTYVCGCVCVCVWLVTCTRVSHPHQEQDRTGLIIFFVPVQLFLIENFKNVNVCFVFVVFTCFSVVCVMRFLVLFGGVCLPNSISVAHMATKNCNARWLSDPLQMRWFGPRLAGFFWLCQRLGLVLLLVVLPIHYLFLKIVCVYVCVHTVCGTCIVGMLFF